MYISLSRSLTVMSSECQYPERLKVCYLRLMYSSDCLLQHLFLHFLPFRTSSIDVRYYLQLPVLLTRIQASKILRVSTSHHVRNRLDSPSLDVDKYQSTSTSTNSVPLSTFNISLMNSIVIGTTRVPAISYIHGNWRKYRYAKTTDWNNDNFQSGLKQGERSKSTYLPI